MVLQLPFTRHDSPWKHLRVHRSLEWQSILSRTVQKLLECYLVVIVAKFPAALLRFHDNAGKPASATLSMSH